MTSTTSGQARRAAERRERGILVGLGLLLAAGWLAGMHGGTLSPAIQAANGAAHETDTGPATASVGLALTALAAALGAAGRRLLGAPAPARRPRPGLVVPGYHADGIDLAAIDAIVGSARRTRPIGERPPWLRDEDARAGVAGAPSVFVTNDDWDPPSERRRGPVPRDR